MNYYKCMDCWRVYDHWQLVISPMEACTCSSVRFKETKNLFIRRLLTDFTHTLKTLFGRETE
jgi:hypothetical protein